MRRWQKQLYLLAQGGVTFALIDAFANVDFNTIWFQFLTTIFSILATLFAGGDLSSLSGGTGNIFG